MFPHAPNGASQLRSRCTVGNTSIRYIAYADVSFAVVSDPDDPRFDLEKLLVKLEKTS